MPAVTAPPNASERSEENAGTGGPPETIVRPSKRKVPQTGSRAHRERLASARAVRVARSGAHRQSAPRCTLLVTTRRGPRACGHRMIQNAPERERGTFWCERHGYIWGDGFGPDQVPDAAYVGVR